MCIRDSEEATRTRRIVSTTQASDVSPDRAKRIYQAALDRVVNSPSGERHYNLWKSVRLVAGYVAGGILAVTDSQIMGDFVGAQATNGSIEKYGLKNSEQTISDAIANGRAYPLTEIENYQEEIKQYVPQKSTVWRDAYNQGQADAQNLFLQVTA